jgi:multimeric flavodoxin WrbA
MVREFLAGAQAAGAAVDNVFLIHQNIGHCTGCFSCWFKTPGRCVLDDDMSGLLEKYVSSDIIALATPVYTWDMTAALKNFVDRLIPLRCPIANQSGENYDMKARVKFPEAVVIANCGFPGANNFATLKEVVKPCRPLLEIYRNCGNLLKTNHAELKTTVDEYLRYVREAGSEIAASGKVSELTKAKLEMELIRPEEYVKMMRL